MNDGEQVSGYRGTQRAGLLVGPLLFFLLLAAPPPSELSQEDRYTAAVAVLMAVWWMTEAIPIPATAILPLGLFPMLGSALVPIFLVF